MMRGLAVVASHWPCEMIKVALPGAAAAMRILPLR